MTEQQLIFFIFGRDIIESLKSMKQELTEQDVKEIEELFLENKEPLVAELDELINNLTMLRNHIEQENDKQIHKQLQQARQIKEELGE